MQNAQSVAVPITQKSLDVFKRLHPLDERIQALQLDEVLENTKDKQVDWNKLQTGAPAAGSSPVVASVALSDCQKAIGWVVFDAMCLGLGAVGLRGSVSASTIEAVAAAAAPAMSKIELIIAKMSMDGTTTIGYATGVFDILKAIYNGNCLGAVFAAISNSLTWWDMILYGITGTATIIATFATDGVAFIAEVAIVLATAGFVASDTLKAVNACSIKPVPVASDGARTRDQSNGAIYVTLDAWMRHIPDQQTYNNLFVSQNIQTVPSVDSALIGEPITENASLVNGGPDGKVYLLVEAGKRWITNPDVFNRFGFNWNTIRTLTPDELSQIPDGATIV